MLGQRSGDALVEIAQRQFVAAVVHLEQQDAIAARDVLRLQQFDIGRIFDHAARIARRESDVLDDRIGGIGGIELAGDAADQMLVAAGLAERRAGERGLGFEDFDSRDFRLAGARKNRPCEKADCDGRQRMPHDASHPLSRPAVGAAPSLEQPYVRSCGNDNNDLGSNAWQASS
jgi:hypothetical protein